MPWLGNRQKIEQLTDERGHGRYNLAAAYDEAICAIEISRRPRGAWKAAPWEDASLLSILGGLRRKGPTWISWT